MLQLKTVVERGYEQMKESQKASNAKRKVLSEAKAKYSEMKAAKVSLFTLSRDYLCIVYNICLVILCSPSALVSFT